MTFKSTPIEDMILPDLPEGKCVNHPTIKAVRKHLCAPCLAKWEVTQIEYEVYVGTKEDSGLE